MNRDSIDLTQKNLNNFPINPGDKTSFFSKDVIGQCPVCIIDNGASKDTPMFKDIQNKGYPVEIILCLKNKDFYKIDFAGILQDHLKNTYCPLSLMDNIVTASHEAYSNAFLWSSLDLNPTKEIRPYDFCDQIEEQLKNPIYGDRLLGVYLARMEKIIEVVFFIQGVPIKWPHSAQESNFRGTSIITQQTDKVEIDEDGKAIRLYFKNN